MIMRKLIDIRW